ncbi:hypothetical protein TNIN_319281 [Trichonephila inaurata madagascariensis]|uniref:Uncharacterized protein n=1 Tax=Trichonephila inaurata madagascariensis TaxID=2747483 RepID=A0A8X7C647_9ARAC|nr:hypothetical protein TNIN_319281 [Trichonephila inaurata madagascariensis]
MDFSPTRQAKIAACEKLRDTVTGISALHKSLLDESLARSPSPRNSFIELYRMSTQAMAMKKEEMGDYSENMDFSPTRQAKIAACEKLRDTVTGISALLSHCSWPCTFT